eukprot:3059634-Prorocentrum_lima.AAC.1
MLGVLKLPHPSVPRSKGVRTRHVRTLRTWRSARARPDATSCKDTPSDTALRLVGSARRAWTARSGDGSEGLA